MNRIIFFISSVLIISQLQSQSIYRTQKDNANNFKFDLPSVWNFLPITEDEYRIDVAIPSTSEEGKIYNKCFDSVVFYIERYKGNLNEIVLQHNYIVRNDSVFKKTGKTAKFIPYTIRNGYKAIISSKSIQITCDLYKGKNQNMGVAEEIFIWQPNTTKVIVIKTNGKAIDSEVKTRILTSFKFI
jgi:hypothetical protein